MDLCIPACLYGRYCQERTAPLVGTLVLAWYRPPKCRPVGAAVLRVSKAIIAFSYRGWHGIIERAGQQTQSGWGKRGLNDIVLRKAAIKDMPRIIELQTRIFSGEQNIPSDDISGFLARKPQCRCAVLHDAVIGAVAVWKENEVTHWGRFVTDPAYRGRHIGTKIARLSFDDLFAQGIDEIYMEAREITAKMVCKMGGQMVGEPRPFYAGTVTPVILKKAKYRP